MNFCFFERIHGGYHMRKFFQVLSCLLLCTTVRLVGQDAELKELLFSVNRVDHDSIYYEYFKKYMSRDLSLAKHYANQSQLEAARYNHSERQAKALRAMAYVYDLGDQPDSSNWYYMRAIEISRSNKLKSLQMYLYNGLGNLYERQDFYDSALRYYTLSLEIAMEVNSAKDEAIAHNNIGLIFYNLFNFDEALDHLKTAVNIKKANGINDGLPLNLSNIAIIYNDQGSYDDALRCLNEVSAICGGGCPDDVNTLMYYSLGYSYFKKGDLSRALPNFAKGLDLARKTGEQKTIANTLYHFGQVNFDKGNYPDALDELAEAERIANEINLRRLKRDIYVLYSRIYERTGELSKVVAYQNKYMAIKDSIFNEQLATNLKDIQLDAQAKQSAMIIEQKESELQRSRLILLLVGVILTLTLIVSILIYRNYRVNQRMKVILEKEIKKRTAELVKSNTDLKQMTQEYDQLVYRASHDIRGPLATLLGLTNVAMQDFKEPERVKDYLIKIGSTAQGLSQTLSQLMETNRIRNMPVCVEEVDLPALVDEVYSSFKSLNHFPLISLRTEKGDWHETLITDKNLLVFILSKLIDNSFKYFSPAKENKYIRVSWSQADGETTIAVEDNGSGIDSVAREKIFQLFYVASDIHGTGLGLFLAQLAANRLGGRIFLARSSGPTIFKLVIASNLGNVEQEQPPVMAVAK